MSLNLEPATDGLNEDFYMSSIVSYRRNKQYYEDVIKEKLQKLEFRVPTTVVPRIDRSNISIFVGLTPETDDSKKDEFEKTKENNYHLMLSDVVRGLGVKLERRFNSYSGKFYWFGILEKVRHPGIDDEYSPMEVTVMLDAAPSGTCTIKEVKETCVTKKYVAECF